MLLKMAIDFMVVSFFGFVSYKTDAMPATTTLRTTVVDKPTVYNRLYYVVNGMVHHPVGNTSRQNNTLLRIIHLEDFIATVLVCPVFQLLR